MGKFGLCYRGYADKADVFRRRRDAVHDGRGSIVALDDDDLTRLVDARRSDWGRRGATSTRALRSSSRFDRATGQTGMRRILPDFVGVLQSTGERRILYRRTSSPYPSSRTVLRVSPF